MYEICIQDRFSAAHHLEGYRGNCAAFHGHNWEVQVFVRGRDLNETGMLFDFRALRRELKAVLEELDHTDLNTLERLKGMNPTSEVLARLLYEGLSERLDRAGCRVHRVTVTETPGSNATYWSDGD